MKNALELLELCSVNQCAFIDLAKVDFSSEVRGLCKMNSCGRYGTNWQCPPGVGNIYDLKIKICSYKNAILFNQVYKIEDSFDIEGMEQAAMDFSALCAKIRAAFEATLNTTPLIMSAGGCKICPACTYPAEPCRFPKKTTTSMEACGINVIGLSAAFGFKYINGKNTVTYFGLVLF